MRHHHHLFERRRRHPSRASFAALVVAVLVPRAVPVHAVTVSEIFYNPPDGDQALEFIEITNETYTPDDLSGWAFIDGVSFVFEQGTILLGRQSIVLCGNPDAVKERYGLEDAVVFGPWDGRLDSGGERLTLVNHVGVTMVSLRYRDDGKWPVAPDGTGHSLVLRELHLDPDEPESWEQSPELGGSPGRPNFPDQREIEFEETVHLDVGEAWRFRRGTAPFSDPPDAWKAIDFDDAGWESGPSGFGFGDDDDATILDDMRGNYSSLAIRARFTLTAEQIAAEGDLVLGVKYDDGFCAYLNGVEVASANCPDEVTHDATATRSAEARTESLFPIERDRFAAGENVFAIVGFNSSLSSGDFSLIPRLMNRRALIDDPPIVFHGRFNELVRSSGDGTGWVELFNRGAMAIDLSGVRLTDDPDRAEMHVFPPGTTIAPGEFLVVSEAESGLDFSTEKVRLFLLQEDDRVLAAHAFDRVLQGRSLAEAHFPDGDPDRTFLTETPTPGEPNRVARVEGVVINEIYYHPPEDRPGEFLELHNFTDAPIDVSGFRFTRGIDFTIPEGTSIAAGGYLVITDDPALLAEHWDYQDALGPWRGQLADSGENIRLLDRLGNIVDEVRYHEGGAWSIWADGRGASLELLDPRQPNDFGTAWEASDESGKTAWEKLEYDVPRYAPAGESELHILLVERGICRIDDVSIVRDGEDNLIPNPGFEEDTRPWRIEGTHVDSHRTEVDSHEGVASLEVVATGKGDSLCNRIETDTSPRMSAGPYTVSLWARWVRGSSLLVLHGEFAPGPWFGTRDINMSNNSLGASLRMTVPWNIGTPGAENSARRNLRAMTESGNIGPVISDVRHHPPVPDANFPVTVFARVADADGVSRVVAKYQPEVRNAELQEAELFDDGAHGDGLAGDGLYAGRIGLFDSGIAVVFWVEATDPAGAVRTFPADAPATRLTFAVGSVREAVYVVQSSDSVRELAARPLHSNDLVDATIIYDDKEIYYNAGIRYRGSPWGRPSRQSYRLAWQKDKPFIGGRNTMNVSNRDRGDGAAHFMISRNSRPGSIAPASDYRYITARINRQSLGQPGFFDTVDRDFIGKWYGEETADDGVVLKGNGKLRFNDGCTRTGWDEATTLHMDESPENYRFYYNHSINQTRDNWRPWMDLTRVLDARHSSPEELDANIDSVLDVEKFLRVFAPRIIMNDGDALYFGNGHNGYMVWDASTGLFSYLPFDLGFAFRSPNSNLFGVRDRGIGRLLGRPQVRRIYYRMLDEYLQGYWNDQIAGPYFDALQRATGVGASAKGFLRSTKGALLAQVRRQTGVEFSIRTNDGEDFTTLESTVQLEGDAPVQIERFMLERAGEEEVVPVKLDFFSASRPTQWRLDVEIRDGANAFTLFGLDLDGTMVGTASITITRGATFVRGDVTRDGKLNTSDAVALLFHLFRGQEIVCEDAADVDDNGGIDLTDAIRLLNYIFLRGEPPAAPYPESGGDTTDDSLGCRRE